MKSIIFSLNPYRFPSVPVRADKQQNGLLIAVEKAFGIKPSLVCEAAQRATAEPRRLQIPGDKIKVICTGDQFSRFIIERDKHSGQNMVKELSAHEMEDGKAEPGIGQYGTVFDVRDGLKAETFATPPYDVYEQAASRLHRPTGRIEELGMGYNSPEIARFVSTRPWNEKPKVWSMDFAEIEKRVLAHVVGKQRIHDEIIVDESSYFKPYPHQAEALRIWDFGGRRYGKTEAMRQDSLRRQMREELATDLAKAIAAQNVASSRRAQALVLGHRLPASVHERHEKNFAEEAAQIKGIIDGAIEPDWYITRLHDESANRRRMAGNLRFKRSKDAAYARAVEIDAKAERLKVLEGQTRGRTVSWDMETRTGKTLSPSDALRWPCPGALYTTSASLTGLSTPITSLNSEWTVRAVKNLVTEYVRDGKVTWTHIKAIKETFGITTTNELPDAAARKAYVQAIKAVAAARSAVGKNHVEYLSKLEAEIKSWKQRADVSFINGLGQGRREVVAAMRKRADEHWRAYEMAVRFGQVANAKKNRASCYSLRGHADMIEKGEV